MKTNPIPLVVRLTQALACPVLLCISAAGAQFENATQVAGLTNLNAYCMGLAWGDYDNDGRLDLHIAAGGPGAATNALYRNVGGGIFERVGAEAGPIATDSHSSFGCAWGDFDNDGNRDLLVVNGGWSAAANDLYWNRGDGTFSRGKVGDLTGLSRVHSWLAMADYDGDGWVDVYAAETDSGSGPFYQRIYRATRSGTFTPFDFAPSVSYANSGTWGDFDNDGDPDLYTCNWNSPSTLWRNDGEGQFTAMPDDLPTYAGALHAAWGDYDNDGDLDIAIGSFSGVSIYRNETDGAFVLAASYSGRLTLPAWADYDNDGHLDLLVVGAQDTPDKPGLYHNNGDGTFTPTTDLFTEAADYWLGCAWGDIDDDGFMDAAMVHQHGRNALFRNLTNDNHWLKIKLVGTLSNRDAIGAKVRVLATIGGQPVWQMREVNGGYQVQNDIRLNFGLGDATTVERVRIEWPSGNVEELINIAADQIRTATERSAITPVRPTVSLNASIKLQTTGRGSLQWRFEGVDLAGQTNSSLVLSNLVAEQDGRYSVVVSNATAIVTNFAYLSVDPTFIKITEGPVVSDQVKSCAGLFGDYDGDGLLDLVVLGDYWNAGANTRLYHNLGGGRFGAVTDSPWDSLTDRIFYSPWADPDNDGDLDLFLVGYEGDQPIFMENGGGGVFTRQTVGVDWTSNRIQPRGWAAAWGDIDNDGLLDGVVGAQRTYPMHNNGDGTFTVMTNSVVYLQTGSTSCYQLIDYDGDGDLDLFMPEEASYSRLYRNEGKGEFTNVTESVLQNRLAASMNGAWADFDNDGDLDLYFMGFTSTERFLINSGDGTFADWTGYPKAILNVPAGMPVWGDYDNDGLLDLLITQAGSPCRLFRNTGDGDFLEVMVGSPVVDALSAQSATWSDYDNDGDLDLFVACNAATGNYLYQNNGNPNHWLKVRLQGTRSNSHGVGARVFATTRVGGKTVRQMRQIQAQSVIQEMEAHFGLANVRNLTLLRVEWPSGAIQELADVAVDQIVTLWEPPALAAAVQPDGTCALSIRAEPNRGWQIQASGDLLEWQTLTTMTSGTVGFEFVDSTATGMNCRFYRVMPE